MGKGEIGLYYTILPGKYQNFSFRILSANYQTLNQVREIITSIFHTSDEIFNMNKHTPFQE